MRPQSRLLVLVLSALVVFGLALGIASGSLTAGFSEVRPAELAGGPASPGTPTERDMPAPSDPGEAPTEDLEADDSDDVLASAVSECARVPRSDFEISVPGEDELRHLVEARGHYRPPRI